MKNAEIFKLNYWKINPKMKLIYCIFVVVFMIASNSNAFWKPVWLTPEQIHLSIGKDVQEFVVTWLTLNKSYGVPTVFYDEPSKFMVGNRPTQNATGQMSEFTDHGTLKSKRYVYRVKMSNLIPNTTYRK